MENIENKVVTESQNSSEEKQSSLKTFSKKDNNTKKNLSNQSEQTNVFEERTVEIKRISKTTKGGRVMRFSALVVVGDKKGTVGFGMGKSNEVPDAIKKAIKNANNNLFKIKMNKRGTVYHEVNGKHGASRIIIKPAPVGKGIVAGGAARAVIELAGFQDIYSKSLGSNTKINVIRATVNGLLSQLSPSEISKARGKDVKDL